MVSLMDLPPPTKATTTTHYDHSNDPWLKQLFISSEAEKSKLAVIKPNSVLPYLNRPGFVPRKVEDFGEGGAFPEIHIAQYPLGMGRDKLGKPGGSNILTVSVDAHGNIAYDAIVKQNENSKKIVYSQYKDLIPKFFKNGVDTAEEIEKVIQETTQETKTALEKIVNVRLSAAQPKSVPKQSSSKSKFIKYKPSQQSAAFNSGAKERVIRMVEMPVDPLELPKFKHKRVPKASGSPPVPIMHSPPRPVTVKDEQDWKIPPCVSNWKNPKGYTIPLEKQHKAREAVALRSKVQKEMLMKEKERKEQELRIVVTDSLIYP
ncbi:hypothetical protein F8388_002544 [Cannabis sativa]|uniref:SKI-interacting protein SKIP SNW domain-containing protein n=1 Tax=Cannabis sativa TaxID=3483 RepID=A0A7J6FB60_CANSA|nr:hypothetical protein F8388_002544 [Cannabis sativa]